MTEPIDQATKEEQPYFHLSKNEHGKMWLMYKPEGNGRYKCWEPITGEFWQEFEKLQAATVWAEKLKQERNKAIDECIAKVNKILIEHHFVTRELITELESLKDKSHE